MRVIAGVMVNLLAGTVAGRKDCLLWDIALRAKRALMNGKIVIMMMEMIS